MTEGEYFGEEEVADDRPSDVTVRTITPCVLATLSRKDLRFYARSPEHAKCVCQGPGRAQRVAINGQSLRRAQYRPRWGFAENVEIPETYVDYSAFPREYSLSAVQTVVRVHTRVSDLYNGPFDQLEEQMRLTIEGIKERQEWDLVNSQKFGLLASVAPSMRISARYGAPTPDDLDDLLAAGKEAAGVLPGASQS